MPHPFKDRVYSRSAADRAVDEFVHKYGRATYFVAEKSGIDATKFVEALKHRFMYSNRRWNRVRDLIKDIENHDMYASMAYMSTQAFIKYMRTKRLPDEIVRNYQKFAQ
jgi:hypothetical protein